MRPLVRFATLRPIRCRLPLSDGGRLFPSGRQAGTCRTSIYATAFTGSSPPAAVRGVQKRSRHVSDKGPCWVPALRGVREPNGFATGSSRLFENLGAFLDPTDFSKLLAAHPLRAFFRISSNSFSGRSLSCLISRLANVFWKRRENLYAALALHFGYYDFCRICGRYRLRRQWP